ncbi:hypothetical protein [Myxococcus sp. Y35]
MGLSGTRFVREHFSAERVASERIAMLTTPVGVPRRLKAGTDIGA